MEDKPVVLIPPEKVEVEVLPRIVVVAVPPTPKERASSPKETVEEAVVLVAEIVEKMGLAELESAN